MVIQAFLTGGLLVALLYALTGLRNARLQSIFACTVVIGGVYLVWSPEQANHIANMMEIGRGADLLLYLCILVGLIFGFRLTMRMRATHELLTELARNVALRHPIFPPLTAAAEEPANLTGAAPDDELSAARTSG